MKVLFFINILLFASCFVFAQETAQPTTTTVPTTIPVTNTTTATTKSTPATTTEIPDECNTNNGTCDSCISNSKCLYCKEDNTCRKLVFDGLFPKGCALSKARWNTCFLDLQALIIAVCSIGGALLIGIFCCACYCCNKTCQKVTDHKLSKIEKKYRKEKAKKDVERAERRTEREKKYDEIRVKYGLKSGNEYAKMDDN